MDKRYVYVILSQTPSKFGRLIRRVVNLEYNHVSIAFDEKLEHMYSFARAQNKTPVIGGIVKEFPERFSLGKVDNVPVRIYRLEVCEEAYEAGRRYVLCMLEDPDYLYNLLSALTYPVFHGFATFKAYTCAEFAANFLLVMGFALRKDKKICAYTPEDIGDCLEDKLYYEGNLLTYSDIKSEDADYFFENPGKFGTMVRSAFVLFRLVYRKLRSCY